MNKLVTLELKGDLGQQGFTVTLQIADDGSATDTLVDGQLPANPLLLTCLKHWQQQYRQYLSSQTRALKPYKIDIDGVLKAKKECVELAYQLTEVFNCWLAEAAFREIDCCLRQELYPRGEDIRVLIRTSDQDLQNLPWHQWDFIKRYSNAEVGFSGLLGLPPLQKHNRQTHSHQQVRILAVLGDRSNIDVDTDYAILNQLPGVDITLLLEPSLEKLSNALHEQSWDILFFAGHSDTNEAGQGFLRINADDTLTVDEVKHGIRRAIANGLQLAIFNSCKGLGVAHALAELQLSQMIVMREAVPDAVAHKFLYYFLQEFSLGTSLYLAARVARQRIEEVVEKDFPCASWLPVIYQHPAAKLFHWPHIVESAQPTRTHNTLLHLYPKKVWQQKIRLAFMSWFCVSILITGVRQLGLLQKWELNTYDHLMQIRPEQHTLDDRILIVAVSEDDIQYQRNQGMEMTGSLSDDALLLLLQKVSPHNPSVVGLDIIHDFPFHSNLEAQLTKQGLIAICRARNTFSNLSGIAPPTQDFPKNRLGFSNIPLDPDNVVRRQFLGMPHDQICPTEQSFSFRIAQEFLENQADISMEWIAPPNSEIQQIQLGSQNFRQLERKAGSYQLSKGDTGGYQILINYRAISPEYVYLRELLSDSLDSQLQELVSDRIILIGVVNPQVDTHLTPYRQGSNADQMPGVVVHAHMISHVVSAALGERPLILWWSEWLEILWIVGWSLVGAAIVVMWRSPYTQALSFLFGVATLWVVCLLLLVQGWWIPLVPSVLTLGLTMLCSLNLYRVFGIYKRQKY